jgi:hypothetical protein
MSYYFQGFPTIQYQVEDETHTTEVVDIFRTIRPKQSLKDDILLYTKYTIQDGERPDHVSQKLYGTPDYYWVFFMVNEELTNIHTDWPLSRKEIQDFVAIKYSGYVLKTNDNIATKFTRDEIVQGLLSGATAKLVSKDTNTNTLRIVDQDGEFSPGEIIQGQTSGHTCTITIQTEFYNATKYYVDGDGNVVHKGVVGAVPVTYLEDELEKNDAKAEIKVVRPQYITRLSEEFFNQINPEVE